MGLRLGLLFLLVLGASWGCHARNLIGSDISGSGNVEKGVDLCSTCEEYADLAVEYLSQNKTQTLIIEALHMSCNELGALEKQCVTLADYYAYLFFAEISLVEPDQFCKKVKFCKETRTPSLLAKDNSCDVCHQAIDDILVKLEDPDTKLDIIEILLKGCNAMKNYVKKCKALVFEYGPLFLTDAEKYLEKTDVCALLHACRTSSLADGELNSNGKIRMVTSSSP